MKLSQEKQTNLYAAIANPITDLRLLLLKNDVSPQSSRYSTNAIDEKLFKLEQKIWREVHATLCLDCDV